MFTIFLTPASISYLTLFIQTLLISLYLAQRSLSGSLPRQSAQLRFLFGFFLSITVLSLLFFLEASFLPAGRLFAVYLENTVLGIGLVFLIQFAYRFPVFQPRQKIEAWLVFFLSGAYGLYEIFYAVWRFWLLAQGQVVYRPEFADYWLAGVLLWAPVIFLRQAAQNRENRASRSLALVFLIPFALGIINLLRTYYLVSFEVYHISLSVGILFTVFIFAVSYLGAIPEMTSFLAKLSGAILTSLLAILGSVAWVVAPAYVDQYDLRLVDQRTLHFAPNSSGGYSVTQVPFRFDSDLGTDLRLTDSKLHPAQAVNFVFPFYGQLAETVYITNDGILGIGQPIHFPSLQSHFGAAPAIFPLLIDLYPETSQDGGVFARQEADRLVVTWLRVPAFYHSDAVYTFQVVLYTSGVFEITYNGLPENLRFAPNDRPEAVVWMLGISPGHSRSDYQLVDFSVLPIQGTAQGLVQDEFMAMRKYLHSYLLPLAYLILGATLLLLVGFPILLSSSLLRPLQALLAGVQKIAPGQRGIEVPVQFNDEIGYLTQAFNTMSGELTSLLTALETRVLERTADLTLVNNQLRKLSIGIEQSPDGVVITDLDTRVEYVNPAFTRITGFAFDEVRGKTMQVLRSDLTLPEVFEQMWQTLKKGETWRGEFANHKKNGEIYWEYNVIAPIHDENGVVTHYVAVKEDITDRKHTEEALQKAKESAEVANRAKSTFLANMSHELRTPLNAILGFTELMARGSNLTPEQSSNLAIVNRSGEHLLALINNILELSKIESGRIDVQKQSFDLYYMLLGLEEMFRLRAEQKGLSLHFERAENVPQYILADHGKLRQVLINLLGNAVKFTHQGGIVLSVRMVENDSTAAAEAASDMLPLEFAVKDTGVGISEADLPHIFSPFIQTESGRESQQGTGLGLSISRQYVEMLGGHITVSSQPDVGSKFAFIIPVALGSAEPKLGLTRRLVGLESGQPVYRLLVVDDVAASRWLLVKILQPLGFDVREAVDGREAVKIWQQWRPHLIFMDIRMPVMDGYEAIGYIRANDKEPKTAIVAITSSAFAEERESILALGCNEFIRKPFRQEQIFDALHSCLGVNFIYQEIVPATGSQKHLAQDFDVSLLPEGWKSRANRAANDGDFLLIQDLIQEIEQEFPGLAQEMYQAVYNFDYARLRALMEGQPRNS